MVPVWVSVVLSPPSAHADGVASPALPILVFLVTVDPHGGSPSDRVLKPLMFNFVLLIGLDLLFHVLNRVPRLHVERDRLARESFHKNLHRVLVK